MTREEELKGLKAMYEEIAAIPDEKRFDYFLNNSPTFRKDMQPLIHIEKTEDCLDDFIDPEEIKLYQKYLALVALKNFTAMMYPNYSKRAEYSARDWSYPLDITLQG